MTNPFHTPISCNDNQKIPCIPGHSHCFIWINYVCLNLRKIQKYWNIVEMVLNLYNCTVFQCSGYFKCPLSYCIPFNVICNGEWDCPQGDDEANCNSIYVLTCSNAKAKQNVCIFQSIVTMKKTVFLEMMSCGALMDQCLYAPKTVNVLLKVLSVLTWIQIYIIFGVQWNILNVLVVTHTIIQNCSHHFNLSCF